MSSYNEEIKNLRINDFIFIAYLVIVLAGLYANIREEKNIKNNNINDSLPHYIRVGIFLASLIIYSYFVYNSYKNYKNSKVQNVKKIEGLKLFSSILLFVAGIVILYIELISDNTTSEISII